MTAPETESTILDEAKRLIHGARQADYGSPRENFTDIAALWSPILGVEVLPEQVVMCMITLKVARLKKGYHRDSVVDIAGYAGVLEMVHNDMKDDV